VADLPGRDKWERKLARVISRVNREALNELLDLLGDPPDLENVPPEWWAEYEQDLVDASRPVLEEVYIASALAAIRESEKLLSAGVDMGEIAIAGSAFASQHSFDLVAGITETTRRQLQTKIARFFTENLTIGEVAQSLVATFGVVRADMIAVTEITRAHTAAEREVAEELRQQGFDLVAIWNTANDEIARRCPICWPKHRKKEDEGGGWDGIEGPPAHIRCRCYLSHEVQ
jgi:hypothetical protein